MKFLSSWLRTAKQSLPYIQRINKDMLLKFFLQDISIEAYYYIRLNFARMSMKSCSISMCFLTVWIQMSLRSFVLTFHILPSSVIFIIKKIFLIRCLTSILSQRYIFFTPNLHSHIQTTASLPLYPFTAFLSLQFLSSCLTAFWSSQQFCSLYLESSLFS